LEEHRDPDDPRDQELGKTFNEHLPPWPNPSALEVVVWRLHRLGLALDMVASALRPEDRA